MSVNQGLEPSSRRLSRRHHRRSSHQHSAMIHSGESTALDRILGAGVIALVVFTTLVHGTVEPWSIAVLELAVAALIAVWAVGSVVMKRVSLKLPGTVAPLGALLGIA
ncbi:MAG: hypothetical protein ACREDR_20995, partial [Blastocatellia bacterium]